VKAAHPRPVEEVLPLHLKPRSDQLKRWDYSHEPTTSIYNALQNETVEKEKQKMNRRERKKHFLLHPGSEARTASVLQPSSP
jgi:hypothetical protein